MVPAALRFLLSPAMNHRILLLTGMPGAGGSRGRRRGVFEFVSGEKGSRILRSETGESQRGLEEGERIHEVELDRNGMITEAWINDSVHRVRPGFGWSLLHG